MKIFYGFGLSIMALSMLACGGEGEESTEENTDNTDSTEVEVELKEWVVDTAQSYVEWYNMDGDEKDHEGKVYFSEGTFSTEGDVVTAGSMTINMASIEMDGDGDKLIDHLMSDHFFNVENYPTATFAFNKHEETIIYGTLSVAGMEFPVEAPADIANGFVDLLDFKIDMSQLPYFQMEAEEAPEEERHDTNIGFKATIVGQPTYFY